jgi:uncharacterized protein
MQEQLFITDGYTVQNYNVSVCTIGNSGYFNLPQNDQLKDSFNSSPIEKRTVDDFGNVIKPIKIFDINFDEERRKLKEELKIKDFKRNLFDVRKSVDLSDSIGSLGNKNTEIDYLNGPDVFNENDAWIQTYSGRRFNPTNPIPESIVIQDIAHALSYIVRFCGHVNSFYSVGHHSILVSYLCDTKDALWGLLHDSSEAYIADLSSPLKRSGLFDQYIKIEKNLMNVICQRFNLPIEEPESVKKADKLLLAVEAKEFMQPIRKDWNYPIYPPPFKIENLTSIQVEELFMKRFYELIGAPELGKLWKKL